MSAADVDCGFEWFRFARYTGSHRRPRQIGARARGEAQTGNLRGGCWADREDHSLLTMPTLATSRAVTLLRYSNALAHS